MIANKESKPQARKNRPDAEGEAARLLPLVGQPMTRTEKWIKKRKLSERSEFFRFPFFSPRQREPRRGWHLGASFLPTFWRFKK